jgi:hypothetical protein
MLLNSLPWRVIMDPDLQKRAIGFFADKPRLGGDINVGTAESYGMSNAPGRAVPGVISFSNTAASIAKRPNADTFYVPGRWFTDMTTMTPDYALWAVTNHGPQTHAVVDTWFYYLGMLEELIKLRGHGPNVALKPIDKTKGFLAENTPIWAPTSMTFIPAVKPYPGTDDKALSFLPGPSTALIHEAWHYFRFVQDNGSGVKGMYFVPKAAWWVNIPRHGKVGENRAMTLDVSDATLTGWKKIEFYDANGATPRTALTTITPDMVTDKNRVTYEYKSLTLGVHNFTARVTDAMDRQHMAQPVAAVMVP